MRIGEVHDRHDCGSTIGAIAHRFEPVRIPAPMMVPLEIGDHVRFVWYRRDGHGRWAFEEHVGPACLSVKLLFVAPLDVERRARWLVPVKPVIEMPLPRWPRGAHDAESIEQRPREPTVVRGVCHAVFDRWVKAIGRTLIAIVPACDGRERKRASARRQRDVTATVGRDHVVLGEQPASTRKRHVPVIDRHVAEWSAVERDREIAVESG